MAPAEPATPMFTSVFWLALAPWKLLKKGPR